MQRGKEKHTGKKYDCPKLVRYGNIRDLTRGSGSLNKKDSPGSRVRTG